MQGSLSHLRGAPVPTLPFLVTCVLAWTCPLSLLVVSQNCVKVQWSVVWCPRCRNGLPFILADLSSFSNTLKRCRKEKKESSVFSQRTEEASAVQYFQVRKCFTPRGGKESFPGDAHLQTHLWTQPGEAGGQRGGSGRGPGPSHHAIPGAAATAAAPGLLSLPKLSGLGDKRPNLSEPQFVVWGMKFIWYLYDLT